jgi:hypothetical protein
MADKEVFYNPNTKRQESRETRTGAEVESSQTKADLQDASKLKAKKTGRGMLPGESIADYKKRMREQDERGQAAGLEKLSQ